MFYIRFVFIQVSIFYNLLNIFVPYFSELKGIFVVDRIETVGRNNLCPELLPDGVRGKSVHVDFNVSPDSLV